MIEYVMIAGGIVILCYVRCVIIVDDEERDVEKKSLGMVTVDLLCMLVAMPVVMLMTKVEDIHAERMMRRLDRRGFN